MSTPAPHILVVEDEWLIAADIEDALHQAEYEVVGPAPSVAEALQLLAREPVDAAILDVNLASEKSFAIAQALIERQIPFTFMSGLTPNDLPPEFRACAHLKKPASQEAVLKQIGKVCRR